MGKKESLDKLLNFLQTAIFALFACLAGVVGFTLTNYEMLAIELLATYACAAIVLTTTMIIAILLFFKKIKELEEL